MCDIQVTRASGSFPSHIEDNKDISHFYGDNYI